MFVLTMSPRIILRVLLGMIAALLVISFAVVTLQLGFGVVDSTPVNMTGGFFNINHERNFPTWFSSVLLAVGGLATLEVARRGIVAGTRWRWQWLILGLGFLYLSMDELISIHERLGGFAPAVGAENYRWFIIAAPLVVIVGVFFISFLRAQPAALRRMFLLGAACYLGGAFGAETVAALLVGNGMSQENMVVGTVQHVEEGLEMVGAAIFLTAIAGVQQGRFIPRLGDAGSRAGTAPASSAT